MAWSRKKTEDLEEMASSTMRWGSGEEVVAYLDWDERRYYLWFEPSTSFADFCEEIDREDMLIGLQNELAQIGVQEFCDLESVNSYCESKCGSDDPYDRAAFYEDYWGNICGA